MWVTPTSVIVDPSGRCRMVLPPDCDCVATTCSLPAVAPPANLTLPCSGPLTVSLPEPATASWLPPGTVGLPPDPAIVVWLPILGMPLTVSLPEPATVS